MNLYLFIFLLVSVTQVKTGRLWNLNGGGKGSVRLGQLSRKEGIERRIREINETRVDGSVRSRYVYVREGYVWKNCLEKEC